MANDWPGDVSTICNKGAVMFEEFKKFAMRGNVVDLAIGVIIGAAFGSIVTFGQ